MQEIVIENGYLTMRAYSAEDYAVNREKINSDCMQIIESYENPDDYSMEEYYNGTYDQEHEEARESFDKITEDFFLDDHDGMIYILYNADNQPVAYAIWSKKYGSENSWLLEFIHTHKEWTNCGFGGALLEQSALNLVIFKGAKEILSVIADKNAASKSMHERFYEKYNLKVSLIMDEGRKEYCANTENLLNKFKYGDIIVYDK